MDKWVKDLIPGIRSDGCVACGRASCGCLRITKWGRVTNDLRYRHELGTKVTRCVGDRSIAR